MNTWEDLDDELKNDEKAVMALMATSSRPNSDSNIDDDDDEVFPELFRVELISTIRSVLKNVQGKTRKI